MGKEFSQLPEAGTLTGGEILALVQDGVSVRATVDSVLELAPESETFVTSIVNNETFVTELVENNTFITELTTNNTFVTELAENNTFITEVVENNTFIEQVEAITVEAGREVVEEEVGTSETLVLADADTKFKVFTNASPVTVTIPPQTSVAWPDNTYIPLTQGGTGAVTVAAGSGVTLRVNENLTAVLNGQWATAAIKRIGEDEWVLFGNLVPA